MVDKTQHLNKEELEQIEENQKTKKGKIKELLTFRRLQQSEIISITFFLFMSFVTGGRGVFLFALSPEEIERSTMYRSLEVYASMEVYGVILIVLSALLILSILISKEPNFYVSSVATFFLALVFIVLGMASWEHGASLWNTYLSMLVAVFNGILTVLGVYWILWKKNSSNT